MAIRIAGSGDNEDGVANGSFLIGPDGIQPGEDQDRQVAGLGLRSPADMPEHLPAVHIREADVQDEQAGRGGGQAVQGLGPGRGAVHEIAGGRQGSAERFEDGCLVLHHEDPLSRWGGQQGQPDEEASAPPTSGAQNR